MNLAHKQFRGKIMYRKQRRGSTGDFLVKRLASSNAKNTLHPNFVTGFVDGEGSFGVNIRKSPKHKVGWEVLISLQIYLHPKEQNLLEKIRVSLGVGKLYKGDNSIELRVQSIKDITNVIITHFDKYPLLSQKRADFELFKQVIAIINRKEHLTMEGIRKIIAIKSSMNNGLNDTLKQAFPDVIPVQRPVFKLPEKIDPYWLAGFVTGEGCFLIAISKSSAFKLGLGVALRFILSQHKRDRELLELIIKFWNCGQIATSANCNQLLVTNFQDIKDIITPFFSKYCIQGGKLADYLDFCKAVKLMGKKAHLTQEGLDQILKIKTGMNRGRD